jgi:hypothetical protein
MLRPEEEEEMEDGVETLELMPMPTMPMPHHLLKEAMN